MNAGKWKPPDDYERTLFARLPDILQFPESWIPDTMISTKQLTISETSLNQTSNHVITSEELNTAKSVFANIGISESSSDDDEVEEADEVEEVDEVDNTFVQHSDSKRTERRVELMMEELIDDSTKSARKKKAVQRFSPDLYAAPKVQAPKGNAKGNTKATTPKSTKLGKNKNKSTTSPVTPTKPAPKKKKNENSNQFSFPKVDDNYNYVNDFSNENYDNNYPNLIDNDNKSLVTSYVSTDINRFNQKPIEQSGSADVIRFNHKLIEPSGSKGGFNLTKDDTDNLEKLISLTAKYQKFEISRKENEMELEKLNLESTVEREKYAIELNKLRQQSQSWCSIL